MGRLPFFLFIIFFRQYFHFSLFSSIWIKTKKKRKKEKKNLLSLSLLLLATKKEKKILDTYSIVGIIFQIWLSTVEKNYNTWAKSLFSLRYIIDYNIFMIHSWYKEFVGYLFIYLFYSR